MVAAANLSIRSARLEFAARFERAIHDYRGVCSLHHLVNQTDDCSQLARLPADCTRRIVRHMVGSYSQADKLCSIVKPLRPPPPTNIQVCVRKRPLWAVEQEDGQYDALTIDEVAGRCTVHDGKAARDMSMYTLHREYALDHCLSASASETAIQGVVVDPLLRDVRDGGRATVVFFGQTGTGKTHTTHQVQQYLAARLFPDDSADDDGHWAFPAVEKSASDARVSIEVFELRGKRAYDLLAERKVVRLVADANEEVHVLGGRRVEASSAREMLDVVARAHALRSVAATERNAQSSRSHAVCRISLPHGGVLNLVDLAGSERNYETTQYAAPIHFPRPLAV